MSYFDGCSCGQVALNQVGIEPNTYYASEINPHSIKITQKNYPNTIQLGDVTLLTEDKLKQLGSIDLMIGGSPCEDLSITAVDRKDVDKGLEGEKSKLFYRFVDGLKIVKPKYFFLENVASMTDTNRDIITYKLGVSPVMINSNIVSAQDRERYYWTNIPHTLPPEESDLVLGDIMESNVDEKLYYNKPFEFYGLDKKICARMELKTHDLCRRVYNSKFKAPTLTAVQGGYQEKKVYVNGRCRKFTPIEYERLQMLPDNYTYGVNNTARYSMCGDGWNVGTIRLFFRNII